MVIRPFELYGSLHYDFIRDRLDSQLEELKKRWAVDLRLEIGSVVPAEISANSFLVQGYCPLRNPEAWVGICADQIAFNEIGAGLLNDSRIGSRLDINSAHVTHELVNAFLKDIVGATLSEANEDLNGGIGGSELFTRFFETKAYYPGCGIIELRFSVSDSEQVRFFVSRNVVRGLLDGFSVEHRTVLGNLQSVHKSLENQQVQIQVMLDGIELSLDSLNSIGIGDVIRLDNALDSTCEIVFKNSDVKCAGYIGKKDGKLAVSVVSEIAG